MVPFIGKENKRGAILNCKYSINSRRSETELNKKVEDRLFSLDTLSFQYFSIAAQDSSLGHMQLVEEAWEWMLTEEYLEWEEGREEQNPGKLSF